MPPSELTLDDLRLTGSGAIETYLAGPSTLGIIIANPTMGCIYFPW